MDYQSGFGNSFQTEAEAGALPKTQNSPQKVPLGLYAEQFSTSSFTVPRSEQRRTWFYRIRPSTLHAPFEPYRTTKMDMSFQTSLPDPNQMRWDPMPKPTLPVDFIDGTCTFAGNGRPTEQVGCAIHLFNINKSMDDRVFFNADGELILIPQLGNLELRTECGTLSLEPHEIAVIPRGLKFQINLADGVGWARGYVGENFGAPLRPPNLGPIGSNGLAAARDFLAPVAKYEDAQRDVELVQKYMGRLFSTQLEHFPLDVVAWHGNSYPYKYDLRKFNTIGTVSFDHPDPSIFTVLTSPSHEEGVANLDFVIFPPRWMVAEHTFRPPYFHRNVMSEFMGLISGAYDAKEEGFQAGGASLHNSMQAHGPDADAFDKATAADLKPVKIDQTMAFMFESRYPFQVSQYALNNHRQYGYYQCWQGLKKHFQPPTL